MAVAMKDVGVGDRGALEQVFGYMKTAASQTREAFVQTHTDPALVVEPFDVADQESTPFATVQSRGGGGGLPGLPSVAFVRKRPGANAFASMVTIGRARNNDVCLTAPDVSKFHAHFVTSGADVAIVASGGASNGTFVNGRPLRPGERAPLACGDRVRLGSVEATFYTPSGFYDYLRNA